MDAPTVVVVAELRASIAVLRLALSEALPDGARRSGVLALPIPWVGS
jgi:hypothetical protein